MSDSELHPDDVQDSWNNKSSPRKKLKISTDLPSIPSAGSSPDSLFDEVSPSSGIHTEQERDCDSAPAFLDPPPIPGLFFWPSLLIPRELADEVMHFCLSKYFTAPTVNQVMLFGVTAASGCAPSTGLPPPSARCSQPLPPNIHTLLFAPASMGARQAIVNLYRPGEGIAPHVDLPARFGDGIVGVSFGSGCAMRFAQAAVTAADPDSAAAKEAVRLFLPARSVLVLSGEARYAWTHGIEARTADRVAEAGLVERGVRLSVTFRWLLPGADVVGGDSESDALKT
ncbi:hypothetical protein FB451DRAFT_1368890 [Mycena latifolia]|nr:hypothetical protein FB451DRAFT_1368890 [Mycena latifolia]